MDTDQKVYNLLLKTKKAFFFSKMKYKSHLVIFCLIPMKSLVLEKLTEI